jgi:hypothetical protein
MSGIIGAALTAAGLDDGAETDPPAALSGPILSSVPADADALRLWDAFAALLESPAFLEARRARSLPQFPRPVKSLA